MTGQINVNKIAARTGTTITIDTGDALDVTLVKGEGSATTNLKQGLCKMWTSFTGITTTAIKDSFNNSSLTDLNSGATNVSITANMSDANWSGVKYSNAYNGDTFSNDYHGGLTNRSSSIMKHTSHNQSAGTDGSYNDVHVMGDLA